MARDDIEARPSPTGRELAGHRRSEYSRGDFHPSSATEPRRLPMRARFVPNSMGKVLKTLGVVGLLAGAGTVGALGCTDTSNSGNFHPDGGGAAGGGGSGAGGTT